MYKYLNAALEIILFFTGTSTPEGDLLSTLTSLQVSFKIFTLVSSPALPLLSKYHLVYLANWRQWKISYNLWVLSHMWHSILWTDKCCNKKVSDCWQRLEAKEVYEVFAYLSFTLFMGNGYTWMISKFFSLFKRHKCSGKLKNWPPFNNGKNRPRESIPHKEGHIKSSLNKSVHIFLTRGVHSLQIQWKKMGIK